MTASSPRGPGDQQDFLSLKVMQTVKTAVEIRQREIRCLKIAQFFVATGRIFAEAPDVVVVGARDGLVQKLPELRNVDPLSVQELRFASPGYGYAGITAAQAFGLECPAGDGRQTVGIEPQLWPCLSGNAAGLVWRDDRQHSRDTFLPWWVDSTGPGRSELGGVGVLLFPLEVLVGVLITGIRVRFRFEYHRLTLGDLMHDGIVFSDGKIFGL